MSYSEAVSWEEVRSTALLRKGVLERSCNQKGEGPQGALAKLSLEATFARESSFLEDTSLEEGRFPARPGNWACGGLEPERPEEGLNQKGKRPLGTMEKPSLEDSLAMERSSSEVFTEEGKFPTRPESKDILRVSEDMDHRGVSLGTKALEKSCGLLEMWSFEDETEIWTTWSIRLERTLQPLSDNELHKRQRPQYVGEDDSDVGQLAEDAVTIRKHTDWLKREAGRQQLDKDGINHRLKKIKTQRREFLKVNSITDGLQEYPILRHRPWLVGEPFLQYGINSIGVLDQILAVLEKLENKIRYKCKLFDEYRQEKDNELQTTIDEAEKKDIMLLYAYRLLPSVFGEKEEYIVVASEKDIQSPAPVIVGTMQKGFNIMAEGERSYAASARDSDWLWRHGLQPFGCFV
ncbi:uncharacterized protein [Macrobrachium rosenbergii]|uniref:uncharacterized protein n=1 Tax=Macrobrachium rosenbergii TaxID=79674 RepID=UPI0034D72B6B